MKGVIVTENGLDGKILFDSRKPRIQVALDRTPAHVDRINVSAGTALVTSAGNSYYAEEILATIKHGLAYEPMVLTYFYIPTNGRYAVGRYFYAFGAADDYIAYRTDETNLYIVHILDDTASNVGVTSTAPSFGELKVKYLICSNPVNALTNDALVRYL